MSEEFEGQGGQIEDINPGDQRANVDQPNLDARAETGDAQNADQGAQDQAKQVQLPDITSDPRYVEMQRTVQQYESLHQTLLADPAIKARAHSVLGMPVPQEQPSAAEEIKRYRALARQRPDDMDLAHAVDEKIEQIRQQETNKAINQAVQQAMHSVMWPVQVEQQIMTDESLAPARPYAKPITKMITQMGIHPRDAFAIVDQIVQAQGGGGNRQQTSGHGGAVDQFLDAPGQARRPNFSNMPLREFDKVADDFLDKL